MTIEHVFHQSDLGQFDFCLERGASLYFNEVEDRGNDSALYGTAIHSGIEATLLEKRQGHPLLKLGDMVEVFGQELQAEQERRPNIEWVKFTPKKLVEMAAKAYAGWLSEVEPLVHPVEVEREIHDTLVYKDEEREIYLAGTLDCVDAQRVIWDWKTSSRPYMPWEKQRWAVQPTVYSFLLQGTMAINIFPATFRYAILLHDGTVQHLVVTRTAEHVEWLRHKLVALAKTLEGGVRPLPLNDTGWHCSDQWCPNWSRCKGAHHGGDDWKQVQKV